MGVFRINKRSACVTYPILRIILLGLVMVPHVVQAQNAETESKVQREARMAWWKEARFGLFIHWGLYSIPAGEWRENNDKHPFLGTEWIMAYRQIPSLKYRELASQFNPTRFDADAWVLAAKNAGMKYIIFTAKHHDGFALFDSAVSDFTVVKATPFKRDVVRELADACQKHGIKLGLYYSQAQDWTHQGGAVSSFMKRWDGPPAGSFAEYIEQVALPQVKEMLTQYGPIAVIWWDTPQDMTPELAAKFQAALSVQPGIIQNSRLIGSIPGDYRVFEGGVPAAGVPGTPWEVCTMMNESWGFSRVHHEWASPAKLIRQLIQTASLSGNYLLNVGPEATGSFPPEALALLEKIGAWMIVNGDAIYGSTGFPTKKLWQQGRITQKPGKLFANIFLWPSDGKLTIPIQATVKKVYLLSQPEKALSFVVGESGTVVQVPGEMPDPNATVLVLEIEGKASESAIFPALDADRDGLFDLLAPYATFSGPDGAKPAVALGKREGTTAPITGDPAEGFKIGGFPSMGEQVKWRIKIPKAGKYTAVAYAGVHKGMPENMVLEVRASGQSLQKVMPLTGDAQTFKALDLGTFNFETAGEQDIVLQVDLKGAPVSACTIWRIQLKPLTQ